MSQQDFSNWDNVRIAPRHDGQGDWTVADYKKLTFDAEEDWRTAVTIFEDRIRERFLNIVDAIENMPYAGFAMMALDCLLIETLNQFYHGVSETPRRHGETYFVEFLKRPPFEFDEDMSRKFYDHVRNGILHQAETKENTRIRTDSELPLVQLTPDEQGLIINRKKFHQKLKDAFEQYVEELRNPESELREPFRRKMDVICRIPLYFAYGSNMCYAQMRECMPNAENIGLGRLTGYALVWDKQSKIDGSAKANIIERAGSEVWGVVYRLSSDDMRKMDRHEGGYEHQNVTVLLQDGAALETVTYISNQRTQDILPTREYWQRVVRGAEEHHLPADYIATLRNVVCRDGS